jgi:hypothetical protein
MGSIGPIEIVVLVAVWIAPAVLVALYASRKGYSYAAFVIIALLVSWPIAWLGAVIAPERRERAA